MSDTRLNGKHNGKIGVFHIVKDIFLILAILGACMFFVDIKTSLTVLEKQVAELIILHPRTQGGMK